jgi:hypothetical protein
MPKNRTAGHGVQCGMRLMTLALALLCAAAPVAAQEPETSPATGTASPADDNTAKLPVSLDAIRKGLEKADKPEEQLKGLDQPVHFKVEVQEKAKMPENVFTGIDWSSPAVPGGIYAYELQQVLFPKTDNPLAQPYAAYSQGELLQVSLTTLLQQLLTPKVVQGVANAGRAHDEQAARDELAKALAEFCASKPDNGAGIFGCDPNAVESARAAQPAP